MTWVAPGGRKSDTLPPVKALLYAIASLLWTTGALGCSGCEPEPQNRPHQLEEDGEAIYLRHCALCHGRDGEGYAADQAPMLANQRWLRSASREFILTAVAEGRPSTTMSAWSAARGGPFTDREIEAVTEYIRSWLRVPAADVSGVEMTGDAARGASVYRTNCARCHGANGRSEDAIDLTNPIFLRSASDGFLQYAVIHGRPGTPMPAFSETLSPTQIDDVVAFVRSFEPDGPRAQPQGASPTVPSLEEIPLVVHPNGPAPQFMLRDQRFVPAAAVHEAYQSGKRLILLDARPSSDWLQGRIPGAIPAPFYQLPDVVARLPRDGTWMVAYCGCPHAASGRVVDALREQGYENTAILDEGINHWREQGFPIASGPDVEDIE